MLLLGISCQQIINDNLMENLNLFSRVMISSWWWWWCRLHPVREHAQDLRPPLGARPASPPTRQAAQLPPRGPSTNPRPLV